MTGFIPGTVYSKGDSLYIALKHSTTHHIFLLNLETYWLYDYNANVKDFEPRYDRAKLIAVSPVMERHLDEIERI